MGTGIGFTELEALVQRDLAVCSDDMKTVFERTRCRPVKWKQALYGTDDGGFWAVARLRDRVLWYNDIEGGFNVSKFTSVGVIPENEYWCNQDDLCVALRNLMREVESEHSKKSLKNAEF